MVHRCHSCFRIKRLAKISTQKRANRSEVCCQLDDAIRIGVDLSRSVFLPAREES